MRQLVVGWGLMVLFLTFAILILLSLLFAIHVLLFAVVLVMYVRPSWLVMGRKVRM